MEFKEKDELAFVEKLLQLGTEKAFKKGESVYEEFDEPQALYYVKNGLVGLTKLTPSGNESLLRVFKPRQFFGHRSLFAGEKYHGTAKCLEDSQVLSISKAQVLSLFEQTPQAYYFLARALAKELRRAENRSVLVSEGHVLGRVASTLLLFKKLYPERLWTRTEIAQYIASRTPTVIKALGELEEQGAIQQNRRHIAIVNESILLDMATDGY